MMVYSAIKNSIPIAALLWILSSTFSVSMAANIGDPSPTMIKSAPHVIKTIPGNLQEGISTSHLETSIKVFFDSDIDVQSINERSFILSFGQARITPKEIEYDYIENSAILNLHNDLTQNTLYTVTLKSSITSKGVPLDANGNGIPDGPDDDFIFHFKTEIQTSQNRNPVRPPYPILFIHGYAASDSIWLEDGKNWREFLTGDIGWVDGGFIPITLVANTEKIVAPTPTQVEYLGDVLPSNADFFMLNFNIKPNGCMYIEPHFERISTPHLNHIQFPTTDVSQFHVGDLLCFHDDPFHKSCDRSFCKVTEVDYSTGWITISNELDCLNHHKGLDLVPARSTNLNSFRYVINLSNLSYQASIARQGYAVGMAIDEIKKATGAEKVIIIAQSMGGLAAREYIQSSSFAERKDVARLLTIVTPHYGSNFSNIGDLRALTSLRPKYIIESDAVRDLRFNYTKERLCSAPGKGDNAPYLFGGKEDAKSGIHWLTNDVDGDGIESNERITGLNEKAWPPEVPMACIIAENLNNNHTGISNFLFCPHSDDIVNCSRQFYNGSSNDEIPNEVLDTAHLYLEYKVPQVCHLDVNKLIPRIMQLVDEPYTLQQAYEVNPDLPYWISGFSNQPTNGAQLDEDCFKFTAQSQGLALLEISNLGCASFWEIYVYSDFLEEDVINHTTSQSTLTPDACNLEISVYSGQTYYIRLFTKNKSFSYKSPYAVKISIDSKEL